jgi:hypothetical protein
MTQHLGPTQQQQTCKETFANKTIQAEFGIDGLINSFKNCNSTTRRITTKCKGRCITCSAYTTNPHGRIMSSINKSRFTAGVDSTSPVCLIRKVVYCITCNICGIKYIGETIRSLKERFLEHRRNIINKKMKSHLIDHFNQPGHSHENLQIQILHQFEESNADCKQKLTNNELEWIRMLSSAYPFGLNENIKGYGNASKICEVKSTKIHPYLFYKFARKKNKKHSSNLNRHKKTPIETSNRTLQTLEGYFNEFNHKIALNSLKNMSSQAIDSLTKASTNQDRPCSLRVRNFITSYLTGSRCQPAVICENRTYINIVLPFINKNQDKMNNSAIFNNATVRKYVKEIFNTSVPPRFRIVYTYNSPYSLSLFNYNKHLRNVTENDLINSQNTQCNCHESPELIYAPSQHIITGNPRFTGTLEKVINLGTKHKFNEPLDASILKNMFLSPIKQLCIKLQNLTNCNDLQKQELQDLIWINFDKYSNKFLRSSSILELRSDIPVLDKTALDNFIITPVDKAGSNYSFCCKKYYNSVMMHELGISYENNHIKCDGNETYKPALISEKDIINKHATKLKSYDIGLKPENQTLPLIYAIPKMHKTPYKFRFISGAKKSSAKPLSIILLNALKAIRTHFHNYCNAIKDKTGISMCWSINNNSSLLEHLKNNDNHTDKLLTYDFSTLFTGLPHDVIITNMFELINKMFTHSKKTFMHISRDHKYGATYYTDSEKCKSSHVSVRCTELLDILQFIVTESYVKFAGFVLKQIKGIPMGGNASSLIADLTLSMIEFRYLKTIKHVRNDILTFRYVDDLVRINIELPQGIYPPELKLTSECPDNKGDISYLDICFSVTNKSLKLYNKTDHFNFEVINSMNASCAISVNTVKGIIISQLIRFSQINTNLEDYLKCASHLCNNYIKNGHTKNFVRIIFNDYCSKYLATFYQYQIYHNKKATKLMINIIY